MRTQVKSFRFLCRTALPLLLWAPSVASAQVATVEPPPPVAEGQIAFSADTLTYDSETDIVTASGGVRMTREGNNLRADRVIWNRQTGEVRAEGNVRVVNPQGDAAYGDSILLTDTLRDGVVENLLLVLEDGGRLAAERATREAGVTTLFRAAYSPCAVVDADGCPKDPTWQITAVKVVHDPARGRIRYEGATLNLFGTPIIALPGLSHPDGTGGGGSGLLVPDVRLSRSNGLELAFPYYYRLSPNRDVTVTPHVYTDVLPMLEAQYRELTSLGPYQISGFVTHGSRLPVDAFLTGSTDSNRGFRAYIEGNGKFQLDPLWSLTGSARYVTDRTFLRRYDISRDDRLRTMLEAERISDDSYISIAAWGFQGLRISDEQGMQPLALPAIDARWRLDDPILGGKIQLKANSLAILRTEGQDSQRAFASAKWERRMITSLGQELTFTAFARGDAYHTDEVLDTPTPLYRGNPGWNGRVIAAVAADLRWPFIGTFLNGTQQLTPRVQIVASPPTENLNIPNEDARAVDLEDSNLFALNRFPGYDRWEDGTRVTYGLDWSFDLPRVAFNTTIGQSYRLSDKPSIFPPGTGLADRFSDFVGRTTMKVGRRFSLVHRFRLDKDSFEVRRNEIDAVVGGRRTYATVGYLRLNRNIDPTLEDLGDREEVRFGARVAFARYWSIFGSTVVNLTDEEEDPLSMADGFEPVRHRLGVAYDDECIELAVTWRRDYETSGDFRRGNTFLFRVALKNLGL